MQRQFLNPQYVFDAKTFTQTIAVTGGKLVFISGQVSYDREGKVIGKGDIRAQCERIFECLGHCLAVAGATFYDVVKLNGYMVDLSPEAVQIYREVRSRYLNPDQLPTSTLVGVQRLVHEDLMLEVEAIACVQTSAASKAAAKPKPRLVRKPARAAARTPAGKPARKPAIKAKR